MLANLPTRASTQSHRTPHMIPFLDRQPEMNTTDLDESVELLDHSVRWRARDASFMSGRWVALSKRIPRFSLEDFKSTLYGELRRYLGEVFRSLALQKESRIEEGHLMPDHVHMMISIPPKYAVV